MIEREDALLRPFVMRLLLTDAGCPDELATQLSRAEIALRRFPEWCTVLSRGYFYAEADGAGAGCGWRTCPFDQCREFVTRGGDVVVRLDDAGLPAVLDDAGGTGRAQPTLAPVAEGAPGQEALRRRATGGGAARPNARARARGRR